MPTGPPSPQYANLNTFVPNGNTLLMNPGDTISIHMFDAPAPGGGHAFEVVINDLTTHQTGFMQASAANGFMTTSASDCAGNPFNFEPEYNTAAKGNIIPWAALTTDISTEFETGHFEACTSLSDPIDNPFDGNDTGGAFNQCNGPYENAGPADSTTTETGDAMCYAQGDTHPNYDGLGTSTAPVQVSHCQDNIFQNGDLDFDGTPYWKEWPTGLRTNHLSVQFPGTVPDLERAAVPAVLLPDRRRAERVDLYAHDPVRLHGAAAGTGRVLPLLDPAPGRPRLLRARVRQRVRRIRPEQLRQGRAVRDQPVPHPRVPRVRGPGTQQHLRALFASF